MVLLTRHLVLIPSYNPGPALHPVVAGALAHGLPVWVVSDGSTDGSDREVERLGARLLALPQNGGKGKALRHALLQAQAAGFTHALTMDADGQHAPDCIPAFVAASRARPQAAVLGQPRFGPDAPLHRRLGRRLANAAAWLAAPGAGIGDALFGLRVYPVAPLLRCFAATAGMQGFDFEPEAVIRLARMGVPIVRLSTPVRYFRRRAGGVSHFRYGRDNLLLTRMFLRLLLRRG